MAQWRVANRQRSGLGPLVLVPRRAVVGLLDPASAWMESSRADWSASRCEANDVPAAVESPSAEVPEMDDLAILLVKDAGCTQNVGSVDPRLVDTRAL